jgi:hypothetical protein
VSLSILHSHQNPLYSAYCYSIPLENLNKTWNVGHYILQHGWGSNPVFSHLDVEDGVIYHTECGDNSFVQENLLLTHRNEDTGYQKKLIIIFILLFHLLLLDFLPPYPHV